MFAKFVQLPRTGAKAKVLRHLTTNTAVFNFIWDDAQWLKYNPISGNLWLGWQRNDEETMRCHAQRITRMCNSGVCLRNVQPIQLYAFEKTFFGTQSPAEVFDDQYETEQANRMAYLHSS